MAKQKVTPNDDPNSKSILQEPGRGTNTKSSRNSSVRIVLRGSEVKSLQNNKVSLEEA